MGVKLFGQCPNRQGTFQKGASPSSSFICDINDNIALLQSIREASDISCFNFSPVRKPSDREEIVRPATPNSFHNRRRQVQLGTSALQRAVDLLSGGGGGGDGEKALVTFILRLG